MNILVVSEKNSFVGRSMADQLKEYGYNVVMSELDVQMISELKENFEALLLYMENEVKDKTQELVYLRDKALEENLPIFYIGEELAELQSIIPANVLKDTFTRPIDVKESARKMDEFIRNHGKHTKKKILVVDDSGAMLRSVKEWLENDYQVILANSGAMAIKYLATNRPDLVLLDYEMPIVDGSQVLSLSV